MAFFSILFLFGCLLFIAIFLCIENWDTQGCNLIQSLRVDFYPAILPKDKLCISIECTVDIELELSGIT